MTTTTARAQTRWFLWGFLVVLALLCSCAGVQKGYVRVEAIDDLVTIVSERHDLYVEGDGNLTPEQKAMRLRSTALLRAVLTEAKK